MKKKLPTRKEIDDAIDFYALAFGEEVLEEYGSDYENLEEQMKYTQKALKFLNKLLDRVTFGEEK